MPRYYTVKLCIALQNPGFTGFVAEGLKKPNFDVIFLSGIINLLFDGLTYNTRGYFVSCVVFFRARRGEEKCEQRVILQKLISYCTSSNVPSVSATYSP